jgi:hypothetical protein
MIINVELLLDDIYKIIKVDVTKKNINDLKKYIFINHNIRQEQQIWYFNNKTLVNNFIIKNGNYTVTNAKSVSKNNITLRVKKNNKIITTPYLPYDLTIKELKLLLLSTKNNIYFNNIHLDNNNTIEFYNLENNNLLSIKSIIRVENL